MLKVSLYLQNNYNYAVLFTTGLFIYIQIFSVGYSVKGGSCVGD